MNITRKKFIKTGALWVPILFTIGRSKGQVLTISDSATTSRSRATVPSLSCPPDGSPDIIQDGSAGQAFCEISAYRYIGCFYTPTQTKQVCKLGFKLKTLSGDISSKTYNAYIYTLSGTTLSSIITNGTSNNVAGTVITGTASTVIFSFPNNPTVNSGTTYAFVCTNGTTDATNYGSGYYTNAGSMSDATFGLWRDNGQNSYNPGGTYDLAGSIYWYD